MEIKNKSLKSGNNNWVNLSLLLTLFLILPILLLLIRFFEFNGENFIYLWDNLLIDYTKNTLQLAIITLFFSLLFGVIPAWLISTSSFFGRNFYDIVLYLPLAVPSYIMAFTYSDILSFTGPLQSFIRKNYPDLSDFVNQDYLQIEVLGIIMALSLFPYVYTVSRVSFSLLGSNYINLSKNLGLSSFKTFYKIILPLSRPAILSGLFLVLMEVFNEYGAVKYFGVNTFTTGIFRAWFSMNDVTTAIQLSIILLIVVFIIFYGEKLWNSRYKYNYKINNKIENLSTTNFNKTFVSNLICFIPFAFGFLFPVIFIIDNVIHIYDSINFSDLFSLSKNTLLVSFITAISVIIIAFLIEFVGKMTKGKVYFYISQLISLGYALPGAVIGMGLIILFTDLSHFFADFPFIGSLFVLIYAYTIRFMAVGKSPLKSSFEKHPESYDETAKNLGASTYKLFQKLHFPINKFALVVAFILTFIDVMKELPITLILRPFNFDTLATQTYEYAIEEMIPKSSVYSLTIIVIGSILLILLKKIISREFYVSGSK
mgnify:CR=1 FL=1